MLNLKAFKQLGRIFFGCFKTATILLISSTKLAKIILAIYFLCTITLAQTNVQGILGFAPCYFAGQSQQPSSNSHRILLATMQF